MEYSMGVVGIGHWFRRLQTGLESVGGIKVVKAVGTKPYESKAELFAELGISRDNYFTADGDSIPPKFFEGLDLVHISNPNEFHASQIRQSLSKGKKAIVEKTYATSRKEFEEMKEFIKQGGFEKNVYLHLHYIHKMPTIRMRKSIKWLSAKHGRIIDVSATFFEPADEEDARRRWLFEMRNGGLFMDWVHTTEVVYYSTGASFGKMTGLKLYATNQSYDGKNPTGVMAEVALKGKRFADGAKMSMSMAKGVDPKYSRKSVMFTFEDGTYARLVYLGSERESKDNRGEFETGRISNGARQRESAEQLPGRSSSEMFVKEIIKLCNGKKAGLSLAQVSKVFRPQWDYQRLAKKQHLIKDEAEVRAFLDNGIRVS